MARKKASKKAERRWLLRVPEDLADWFDAHAEEMGISRNTAMLNIMAGYRHAWEVGDEGEEPQAELWEKARHELAEQISAQLRDALGAVKVREAAAGKRRPEPPPFKPSGPKRRRGGG